MRRLALSLFKAMGIEWLMFSAVFLVIHCSPLCLPDQFFFAHLQRRASDLKGTFCMKKFRQNLYLHKTRYKYCVVHFILYVGVLIWSKYV